MASEQPLKVAIQGIKASFHDEAARKYFGASVPQRGISEVECSSFTKLSAVLRDRQADFAVMAIENSIAGSILPNYSLLEMNSFKIVGEVYLRIEMNFMALTGQKMEGIRFVQSHPMALLQCAEFLSSYPDIKVIESADTAESGKEIGAKKLTAYGAIASRLAAETYGLEILESGIETNKQNYTRFLVICRHEDYSSAAQANKTSIRFETVDRPGSLAKVLDVFNRHSVNMTKIQSVPILGRPYEYSFHVDLEWEDLMRYREALVSIKDAVIGLIHFGDYPKGERPFT